MGKSLSEQIAEIANKPAIQDFDIEDSERAVFDHKNNTSDDELNSESEDEALQKSHYVGVEKSKLRDDGIALKDEKYQGTKGSRSSLFDNEAQEVSGDEVIEEEEEEQDSEAVPFRTDSEDGASAQEESDSEESEQEDEDEDEHDDSEVKRKRLAQLVQEETKQALNKLSQSTQRDSAKGFAIMEQSKFFDNVLDVRIKLQKAVAATNELPLTEETWSEYVEESAKNKKLLAKTIQQLGKVMAQVVDFRKLFQKTDKINPGQEDEREDTSETESHKRSFSELVNETGVLDSQLRSYRTAVLNKWSSKVSAASGKAALSSSKFKAINQPADVQVENQLADLPRLLKRTRLNRRNVVPLGFEQDLKENRLIELKSGDTNDNEEEENPDIPKNYDPRRKDNLAIDTTQNPYVFDDEDFYRVLLNDLVDKKISNAQGNANGANIALTSRSNNKLKKNVDTKASKGRKLKYTIQEPIANYEAPIDGGFKWSDEQIDEFFAGLMGQRVNFDEEDGNGEEQIQDGQDVADLEAIKNDDIQIFG